jgi:hypothetical protein
LEALNRNLQMTEAGGERGDHGVTAGELVAQVDDQTPDAGVLRAGVCRQDSCDALGELLGHRLRVLSHRARPVVDIRALRANS